ncbi:MAG: class I SAM-dependent methyltransferase [Kiloniellales bacterium]|nr:class I SAM-dependent methyltransferase [Kiloniellales bacterium]
MTWSEDDSALFIDEGKYFVPERETQIATICAAIPPLGEAGGAGHIVELCSGEGLLTRALLERFPEARLHAFDGSPRMLEATRRTAGELAERLETHAFDLAARDWRTLEFDAHAVVTSLAVHHLDGAGKQVLFKDVFALLAPGGVFVLADLVEPARPAGQAIAAAAWDEAVKQRALQLDGNMAAFERFQAEAWNYYSDPEPDPVDQPSALFDLLKWLEQAGFAEIDVHYLKAGHAIISGVRA